MLLITLEGGVVQGVYSDDSAMIGQPTVVNDYDTDGQEEEGLVDLFDDGAYSHLHVEFIHKLGCETAEKIEEWRNAQ
jgi:hypothetical protein